MNQQSQKTYYKDIIEHPNRQFRPPFRFQNNTSCVFLMKKLELSGNQFKLKEITKLNHGGIHYLFENRQYLQTGVK